MTGPFQSNLHARVVLAAEAALKRDGSVGPLHLLMEMRFLPASHFENWRQGRHDTLQRWIQVGPAKLQQTIDYFRDWVKARGLRPIEAEYTRCGPRGLERLTATPTK
jgi:hypothetical protein